MNDSLDDFSAIDNVLSGQQDAYAILVRKYQDKIFRLCLSMLSDRMQAEDAAQDAFVKAYQALKKFNRNSSFSTWLYRIASNHCLDLLRKKTRQKTESWEALLEKEGEKIHHLLLKSGNETDAVENADLIDRILSLLSPEHRAALVLREIDGFDYQEIAVTLNCSLNAVKGRLKRARRDLEKKLRHFLSPHGV